MAESGVSTAGVLAKGLEGLHQSLTIEAFSIVATDTREGGSGSSTTRPFITSSANAESLRHQDTRPWGSSGIALGKLSQKWSIVLMVFLTRLWAPLMGCFSLESFFLHSLPLISNSCPLDHCSAKQWTTMPLSVQSLLQVPQKKTVHSGAWAFLSRHCHRLSPVSPPKPLPVSHSTLPVSHSTLPHRRGLSLDVPLHVPCGIDCFGDGDSVLSTRALRPANRGQLFSACDNDRGWPGDSF